MDKLLERSLLYDYYAALLTERQRNIYESSAFEDLSLGEIAEQEGISRQAVHDLVRRTESSLREYEEKLHLVERFAGMKEQLDEIVRICDGLGNAEGAKIKELCLSLRQEL